MKNWGWVILLAVIIVIGGYFLFTQAPSGTDDSAMETTPGEETTVEEGDGGSTIDNGTATEDGGANEAQIRTFDIAGTNFEFSEAVLRVNRGDTVRINFSVAEGFHDWVIDEFDARTQQMQAGGRQTIEFVADQAGEFDYYCSVGNHRQMGMVGRLIVEE